MSGRGECAEGYLDGKMAELVASKKVACFTKMDCKILIRSADSTQQSTVGDEYGKYPLCGHEITYLRQSLLWSLLFSCSIECGSRKSSVTLRCWIDA
jgi:hypothetical protein